MNFIAGYLMIITKDEEKSFWLMDALLGRILPGTPTSGMVTGLSCLNLQLFWFDDKQSLISTTRRLLFNIGNQNET